MNKRKNKTTIALAFLLVISGTLALFMNSFVFMGSVDLMPIELEITESPDLKIPGGVEGESEVTVNEAEIIISESNYFEPSYFYSNAYTIRASDKVNEISYTSSYDGLKMNDEKFGTLASAEEKVKESEFDGYLGKVFILKDGAVLKEISAGESGVVNVPAGYEFQIVTLSGLGYQSDNSYLGSTFDVNWEIIFK